MRLIFALFFGLAITQSAVAQFTKVKTITHSKDIGFASVDRPGELYLIFNDNTIERYGTSGSLLASGTLPFRPDIFDPRDGSRLFAYSRERSEYLFFAPFFSFPNAAQPLDSAFVIDPFLACSSGDQDLLIVDAADWSLKKVNLRTSRVLFESVINDSTTNLSRVTFMREYQNMLFMLDPVRGVVIFNMLGRRLKTIEAPGIRYFGFLGEEVYYLNGDSLILFDLFNTETRSIRLPYAPDIALLTDERLYLVRGKTTEVFSVSQTAR